MQQHKNTMAMSHGRNVLQVPVKSAKVVQNWVSMRAQQSRTKVGLHALLIGLNHLPMDTVDSNKGKLFLYLIKQSFVTKMGTKSSYIQSIQRDAMDFYECYQFSPTKNEISANSTILSCKRGIYWNIFIQVLTRSYQIRLCKHMKKG